MVKLLLSAHKRELCKEHGEKCGNGPTTVLQYASKRSFTLLSALLSPRLGYLVGSDIHPPVSFMAIWTIADLLITHSAKVTPRYVTEDDKIERKSL